MCHYNIFTRLYFQNYDESFIISPEVLFFKTVIRYSWVLDNNGIKGPQIAKRKKASQSSFNYKNLERESQWQFLVERSRSQYEHKWHKHCRIAFKYKNYKRFCLIYVICFCNLRRWKDLKKKCLTSIKLCVSSFLYTVPETILLPLKLWVLFTPVFGPLILKWWL